MLLLPGAQAAAGTVFSYRDAHFRLEHLYFASDDELLVRFDGPWLEADRTALERGWGLERAEPYVPGLRLGVYRTSSRAAAETARSLGASPPRRRDLGLRTHVGLSNADGDPVRIVPGQIIVQFDRAIPEARMLEIVAEQGCTILTDFWTPGYYRLGLPRGRELFDEVVRFNQLDGVDFACPDHIGFDDALFVPDDPLYPSQWHHNNVGQLEPGIPGADIESERAWDICRGDSMVVVAVVDWGVDLTHPDLAANILERPAGEDWSFFSTDSTGAPYPPDKDHGTNCAGIIAAVGNNLTGVSGVAPECTIMPLQCSLGAPSGYPTRADAINYAISWLDVFPRLIINGSWKTDVDDPGIRLACENAFEAGCVLIFAAGNDGGDIEWPARYSSTFAVGATNQCDTRVLWNDECGGYHGFESNIGDSLDVVAPGNNIPTTDNQGDLGHPGEYYMEFRGTSASAPVASGIAALVWSVAPPLTNVEVMDVLRFSAEDQVGRPEEDTPGWDPYHGWGRVNAYDAIMATGYVRGAVAGSLRVVTDVVTVPDGDLDVLDVGGNDYDYAISAGTIDAQNVDRVHITGTITDLDLEDENLVSVNLGLITAEQVERALTEPGCSVECMFNQAVFVQMVRGPDGVVASAADYRCNEEGGCGEAHPVAPAFTFDLMLVPSDTTGGMAYLSINGAPYDSGLAYGTDDWNFDGGEYGREDLSEAHLLAQIRRHPTSGGFAAFRSLRVETIGPGAGGPLAGHVEVLGTGESTDTGPDGAYVVQVPAFSEAQVVYSGPDFYPDTIQVNLAYGDTLYQPMGLIGIPLGALAGTVTASGDPADSIMVWLLDEEALADTTEEDGQYTLERIVSGVYDVRFLGAGYGPRHVRDVVILPDSLHILDIDILAGFDDDMESGVGYWTHSPGDTGFVDEWHISEYRNATVDGDSSWKCGGPRNQPYSPQNYSILRMPPVVVQPGQFLSIDHWISVFALPQLPDSSLSPHGGRAEASADSGQSWEILYPIGGYPYRTPWDYDGPLGARTPIFSGVNEWESEYFGLSAYQGDTLFIRFVFAADSSGTPREGWYIDNILVSLIEEVSVQEPLTPFSTPAMALFPNIPNPFNPRTIIPYRITDPGRVVVRVFDVSGRLVVTLVESWREAGVHRAVWAGLDGTGRPVGSGVYYCELRTGDGRLRRSMILLR